MSEVAEDIKAIFKARRQKTARALAEEFVEIYLRRRALFRKPSPFSRLGSRTL